MTEPINKYQIQLNPKWKVLHSIIGHLYPAALAPVHFTIKLLRIVEINSMGLVKLWSNLDFTKDVRQWTQVTIQEILAQYQEKLKS